MKSTFEPLEDAPGKRLVKLTLTIDEAEFDHDIDRAFRKLANEVRLPGFRPGKVPRKVLEARIGLAPAREQALRDSIPTYLANAVREHDIDLVATPEVEITSGADELGGLVDGGDTLVTSASFVLRGSSTDTFGGDGGEVHHVGRRQ